VRWDFFNINHLLTLSVIVLHHGPLRDHAWRILEAAGVPSDNAWLAADSLVAANLRGVDSHGVQLLPHYVRQIEAGGIDPATTGKVISRGGACAVYDAQHGLGQPVAAACCDVAVELAREHGAGAVTVRDGTHFGACAYWGERIAAAGMIGVVMCNATPLVAPWQGKERQLGTNPICMAVPGPRTWLLDMATTTVALNKIHKAALCGQESIPAGWAMDADGRPTTSTQTALAGLPTPLGGYKGSGLAVLVEILSAVLSGGAMLTDLGGLRRLDIPMRIGQFYLALDIARFVPPDEFTTRMQFLRESLTSSQPAAGYDEVLIAGDPEWRIEDHRRATGIPIEPQVWASLEETAEKLGIARIE
jgi:LDH2 family malate/lactate/ureidoglycolate dehydrogenase